MKLTKQMLLACMCAAPITQNAHAEQPKAIVELGEPQVRNLSVQLSSFVELLATAKRHARVNKRGLAKFETSSSHKIVVQKSTNLLYLFKDNVLVDVFQIARSEANGDKVAQGDKRTPEGLFQLDAAPTLENKRGWKRWITINTAQRAKDDYAAKYGEKGKRAVANFEKKHGLISTDLHVKRFNATHALPGTLMWRGLGIHGGGNGANWTLGCIGMADEDVMHLSSSLATVAKREKAPVLIIP